MDKETKDNSLTNINTNSFLHKIKKFFANLFYKSDVTESISQDNNKIVKNTIRKNDFEESIKTTENDETRLLKLQKQFRCGKVKEYELNKIQINSLYELYDKQITNLKKSNEIRKQKLLEYRKRNKENMKCCN